jgi:hypothetical protein
VVQASTRYRYPIEWTFWFLAAYAVVECMAQESSTTGQWSAEHTHVDAIGN